MVGVPYRNAVGCLMFLIGRHSPDLAAAVGVLSEFAADPFPTLSSAEKVLQIHTKHKDARHLLSSNKS